MQGHDQVQDSHSPIFFETDLIPLLSGYRKGAAQLELVFMGLGHGSEDLIPCSNEMGHACYLLTGITEGVEVKQAPGLLIDASFVPSGKLPVLPIANIKTLFE